VGRPRARTRAPAPSCTSASPTCRRGASARRGRARAGAPRRRRRGGRARHVAAGARPGGRALVATPDPAGRGHAISGRGGSGTPTRRTSTSSRTRAGGSCWSRTGSPVLREGSDGLWNVPYGACRGPATSVRAAPAFAQYLAGRLVLPPGAGESAVFVVERCGPEAVRSSSETSPRTWTTCRRSCWPASRPPAELPRRTRPALGVAAAGGMELPARGRARGLGTAWTTLHLRYEREVAELLGIPRRYARVSCSRRPTTPARRSGRRAEPLESVLTSTAGSRPSSRARRSAGLLRRSSLVRRSSRPRSVPFLASG
jgi:hypothetical protein